MFTGIIQGQAIIANKSKDSIRDGRWSDSLKSECGIHVNEEEDKKYYPSV